MKIGKYSLGIGDRFAHEGIAQLRAVQKAEESGLNITPVWNKSNREHIITGTSPADTRLAADAAVKALKWKTQYLVDADHINLSNVDKFIDSSDFITIDVADYIGKQADKKAIDYFVDRNIKFIGKLSIQGINKPLEVTKHDLKNIASKYLLAISEAGKIYRHIESKKGANNFVTEVSMDEIDTPQTPKEFLFILFLLAEQNIPLQTIAPRFTGQFNKGVDYVGDVSKFASEFEEFLMIINYAVQEFGLPDNLKLSLHSGSDKFLIYPVIKNLLKKHNKGIHIKTAGTTWLEEMIGLALASDETLNLAKSIYCESLSRINELCLPYETVINIDRKKLPSADEVKKWNSEKFANTLRHITNHPDYNPHFRQLIHVGYKVAAEYGKEFTSCLQNYSDIIGEQVTENLFNRHICRLFDLKTV
jgi:tagaturonate epimerase